MVLLEASLETTSRVGYRYISDQRQWSTVRIALPGAIDPLMEYNWPGNIQELQNVVE